MIDILKNREMFAQRFRGRGLEFGALCNPSPVEATMSYADYLSTAQLKAKYPDLQSIINVDYVLRSDDLREIPDGLFDFVIANQVIRGGPGNLNTAMSGDSALSASPRSGPVRSKEHE